MSPRVFMATTNYLRAKKTYKFQTNKKEKKNKYNIYHDAKYNKNVDIKFNKNVDIKLNKKRRYQI